MESYFYMLMFLLNGELPWFSKGLLVNGNARTLPFGTVKDMKNTRNIAEELWTPETMPGKVLIWCIVLV
jgi:hypothetical protein